MDRQSGLTVTITVSLLTLVCSTLCCATGVYALTENAGAIDIHRAAGIPLIGLGLLLWVLPPLLWLALIRNREERTRDI